MQLGACPMSAARDVEVVLDELAERFALDRERIGRPAVYAAAIESALAVMPAASVVDEVVAGGPMRGAREPWGVVLARLRQIPTAAAARTAREAGRTMSTEAMRAVAEERHRARLASLVAAGALSPEEADAELASRGFVPAPAERQEVRP